MAYDNTNRWTLGKNRNKTKETQADYKGSINIEGADYWLDGWITTNKATGEKFFSGSAKLKDAPSGYAPTGHAPSKSTSQQGVEPMDDDIPFAKRHWQS
jgi:hypothetical protein